jgi:hypothetical protein
MCKTETSRLLTQMFKQQKETNELLRMILERLPTAKAVGFTLEFNTSQGDEMDFTLDDKTGVGTFTATPEDANNKPTTLPDGASTPAYTVTDATGKDVTGQFVLTPNGLTCAITVGPNTVDGVGFVGHVDSVLADGTTHLDGDSNPFDVVPAPPGAAVKFEVAVLEWRLNSRGEG